jgi:hypothetical protein
MRLGRRGRRVRSKILLRRVQAAKGVLGEAYLLRAREMRRFD